MQITHVITTINRGGAENHLASLVFEQIKQGLQVAVVYLKGDGYWANSLREQGVRVESLDLKYYGHISPLKRLTCFINQLKPDVIHAHMPPAELYARLAILLSTTKASFIISKHNDEAFYKGIGQVQLGRWVAKPAHTIIAISDSVNKYMQDNLGVSKSKIKTIYYGIDLAPYEKVSESETIKIRSEWGVVSDTLLIGTVARLVPQKALHILIAAYAKYKTKATKKSRLVIVGRGPLEDTLKKLAKDLGVDDDIVWAGFREDIPQVMKSFDVFALTSSYEGFGLVLLEAMASSKAVIASNVSAIPEIVKDNTGILCAPTSIKDFSNAFSKLESTELCSRYGVEGYKRVKNAYTLERMAEDTLLVYNASLGLIR